MYSIGMSKQISELAFELRGLISRYVNIESVIGSTYMTCPKCLSSFDNPLAWRDGNNMTIDSFGSSVLDNYRCQFCENNCWNIDIHSYNDKRQRYGAEF